MTERIKLIERKVLSAIWATLESVEFDYLRNDGRWQRQTREVYDRGDGVVVLPYNLTARQVILTRQFRLPAWLTEPAAIQRGFVVEAPAGMLESDETDPGDTARREVLEETGFTIGQPQFLFSAYVSPGSITERLHFFVAPYESTDRQAVGGGLEEEGEEIDVLVTDIDQAVRWLSDGSVVDAKTIILLQYVQLHVF